MGDARSGGAGSCGSLGTHHVKNSRQARRKIEEEKWVIYAFMQNLHDQKLLWRFEEIPVC